LSKIYYTIYTRILRKFLSGNSCYFAGGGLYLKRVFAYWFAFFDVEEKEWMKKDDRPAAV
jgi:hypothetical protein